MQVLLPSVFNAILIVIFIVRKSRVPHSVALPDHETDCRFATVAAFRLYLHAGGRVLGLIKQDTNLLVQSLSLSISLFSGQPNGRPVSSWFVRIVIEASWGRPPVPPE
jgi:hypothetical protein